MHYWLYPLVYVIVLWGASSTNAITEIPYNCTCESARLLYWMTFPDVANHNLTEPVYHYEVFNLENIISSSLITRTHTHIAELLRGWTSKGPLGTKILYLLLIHSGILWFSYLPMSGCHWSIRLRASGCRYAFSNTNIWINTRFIFLTLKYDNLVNFPGGAFAHFNQTYPTTPSRWPCELCMLNESYFCDCWQARVEYWHHNPDVSLSLDPLFHFAVCTHDFTFAVVNLKYIQAIGKGEMQTNSNRTLYNYCSTCDNLPILLNSTDSYCNCPNAAARYLWDYNNTFIGIRKRV